MSHPVIARLLLCIVIPVSALAQDSSKPGKTITFPTKLFSTFNKKTRLNHDWPKQAFGNIDSTYVGVKKNETGGQLFRRLSWLSAQDDNRT